MGFKSRRAVQLIFLGAFVLLMVKGRIQLWMAVFLISLIGAAFFGRFYCGYVCPTNTLTEGIDWLYQKMGIKRKEVPGWVKSKAVRFGILLLFLATMVITLINRKKAAGAARSYSAGRYYFTRLRTIALAPIPVPLRNFAEYDRIAFKILLEGG